jgi:hypothetical protein
MARRAPAIVLRIFVEYINSISKEAELTGARGILSQNPGVAHLRAWESPHIFMSEEFPFKSLKGP